MNLHELKLNSDQFGWEESIKDWLQAFNTIPKVFNVNWKEEQDGLLFGETRKLLFYPRYYYQVRLLDFWILLELNGKARFKIPNEGKREFNDLINFQGDWEAAFKVLINIIKNGWPQEPILTTTKLTMI